MLQTNEEYDQLSVDYDEGFVHIQTDAALLKFLSKPGNDSINLAKHLKNTYRLKLGKALEISDESLSVEILIHVYLDVLLNAMGELSKRLPQKAFKDLVACMERLKGQTKIIDCGEKAVDPNRYVFDSLVPCRNLIYAVLGRFA